MEKTLTNIMLCCSVHSLVTHEAEQITQPPCQTGLLDSPPHCWVSTALFSFPIPCTAELRTPTPWC